eukprot:XP_016879414.1 uncharacterized protein LOC107984859 isoform X2 [Homo sapiens]
MAETSHLVSWPLLDDPNSAHTTAPPQCSSPTGLPLHLPWLCPAPAPGPSHMLSLSPARTICWSRAEAASFERDLYPPLPYRCTTPIHHHTYDVIFSEATRKPLGAQRPRLTRQLGRAGHRGRSDLPRSCSDMEPQPGFLTPLLPYQADAQVCHVGIPQAHPAAMPWYPVIWRHVGACHPSTLSGTAGGESQAPRAAPNLRDPQLLLYPLTLPLLQGLPHGWWVPVLPCPSVGPSGMAGTQGCVAPSTHPGPWERVRLFLLECELPPALHLPIRPGGGGRGAGVDFPAVRAALPPYCMGRDEG